MKNSSIKFRQLHHSGMTLVELLVVLVILGILSGMAVTFTGNMEKQTRYDATVKQVGEMRTAIIGTGRLSPDGKIFDSSFLQDVGWLPHSADDLVKLPDGMSKRTYDSTWKTSYGWNGPYLTLQRKRSDDINQPLVYDGWGRNFYGWPGSPEDAGYSSAKTNCPPLWKDNIVGSYPDFFSDDRWDNPYEIKSLGSDGENDSDSGDKSGYKRDIPDSDQKFITTGDWLTDLSDGKLKIIIVNHTDTDFKILGAAVRLRIIVPQWDKNLPVGFNIQTETDPYISAPFKLNVENYAAVSDPDALKPYVREIDSDDSIGISGQQIFHKLLVPNGRRMIFLVGEDGNILKSKDKNNNEVEVDAYAELNLSRNRVTPVEITIYIKDRN